MKKINATKFLIIVLIVVSVFTIFYYKKVNDLKGIDNVAAEREVKALVEEVGKVIVLPTGELPAVATVTDLEKVKDQLFFAKAKIGDYVLIYQNARKAYLYDSENKKILEVAPVNFGTTPEKSN